MYHDIIISIVLKKLIFYFSFIYLISQYTILYLYCSSILHYDTILLLLYIILIECFFDERDHILQVQFSVHICVLVYRQNITKYSP